MGDDSKKIDEQMLNLIARLFNKNVNELSRETRFVQDLFAKSANIIQLIAALENEHDVLLPIADAVKAKTIGDMIDMVSKLF
jgi:acyl carrier protein